MRARRAARAATRPRKIPGSRAAVAADTTTVTPKCRDEQTLRLVIPALPMSWILFCMTAP